MIFFVLHLHKYQNKKNTDNVSRQTKSQETSTMTTNNSGTITTPLAGTGQNHVGSQIGQDEAPVYKIEETSKSEGTQAGGTLQQHTTSKKTTGTGTRTKDYNDEMVGYFFPFFISLCQKRNFFFQMHEVNVRNPNFIDWF